MDILEKLRILSAAAKYDLSCSSSGSSRCAPTGGLGDACSAGICHTWAADGRCVSLLKVLLSNAASMLQSMDPGSASWQAINSASATLKSVIMQETPTQSEVAGAMAVLTQAMAGIY